MPPLVHQRSARKTMSNNDSDPIVAIATAPGRGGIGVIRLSFGRAGEAAAEHAMLTLCGQLLDARHASYVPFIDARGEPPDRGIALYFPPPNSSTADHRLQFHV